VLKETRLDATYLELELTESLVMEVQQAIAILQLHDMGITLSLDDFGTVFVLELKRFPIHALKIDQSCARPCFRLE